MVEEYKHISVSLVKRKRKLEVLFVFTFHLFDSGSLLVNCICRGEFAFSSWVQTVFSWIIKCDRSRTDSHDVWECITTVVPRLPVEDWGRPDCSNRPLDCLGLSESERFVEWLFHFPSSSTKVPRPIFDVLVSGTRGRRVQNPSWCV